MLKKLVPNFFYKEKNVLHNLQLTTLFKARIEAKNIYCVSAFNQSQWLKPYGNFSTIKGKEAEKL